MVAFMLGRGPRRARAGDGALKCVQRPLCGTSDCGENREKPRSSTACWCTLAVGYVHNFSTCCFPHRQAHQAVAGGA